LDNRVLLKLDQFPEQIQARARDAITQLTNQLLRQVQAAEPNLLRPHTHAYVDQGISKRGGAWGLWVMPVAGGAATQVTAIEGELPDWLVQAVDWAR